MDKIYITVKNNKNISLGTIDVIRGHINSNVLNLTEIVSLNLLLAALPNDTPQYFGGKSFAISAYKYSIKIYFKGYQEEFLKFVD